MTNACYDTYARQSTLREWESSSVDHPLRLTIRGALVAREDVDPKLISNIAITDAKALYDALERDCLKAKEKQVALVTAEIKQVMAVVGLVPRWMPHNEMAVDGLTKDLKKSNIKPLLRFMKTGQLRLTAETDEMNNRKETKAAGGKVGRDKGGRDTFDE